MADKSSNFVRAKDAGDILMHHIDNPERARRLISTRIADAQPLERTRTSTPMLICAASVRPEQLKWVWEPVLPLGKLTQIAGDPGLGKSLVTIDIAAHITTGTPFPCEGGPTRQPGSVVMVNCEDVRFRRHEVGAAGSAGVC